ncbi:hypothetical protein PFISCL1PPCAC_77, partial [Pristionchus fissidentatus]
CCGCSSCSGSGSSCEEGEARQRQDAGDQGGDQEDANGCCEKQTRAPRGHTVPGAAPNARGRLHQASLNSRSRVSTEEKGE